VVSVAVRACTRCTVCVSPEHRLVLHASSDVVLGLLNKHRQAVHLHAVLVARELGEEVLGLMRTLPSQGDSKAGL
jgi:hypothetical protein